jgi:CDK-activating kinase assembly factor MAT1
VIRLCVMSFCRPSQEKLASIIHCHCIQHNLPEAQCAITFIIHVQTSAAYQRRRAAGNAPLCIMGADSLLDRESRVRRKVEAMCVARMSHPRLHALEETLSLMRWLSDTNLARFVKHSFNKREADFASRAEWDNYLEEREDIAFNLIENIDVAASNERLSRYEQENAESIVAVAARQVWLKLHGAGSVRQARDDPPFRSYCALQICQSDAAGGSCQRIRRYSSSRCGR